MTNLIFYTGTKTPPSSNRKILWTPTIEIEYISPIHISHFHPECNFVFFSQHGVEGFQRIFPPPQSNIFAVGKKTAQCIKRIWGKSCKVPEVQNAQGMITLFKELRPQYTVVVQGDKGRVEFSDWLMDNDWPYSQICVYKTTLLQNKTLRQSWRNSSEDYVVFTSPTAVKGFLKSTDLESLDTVKAMLMSIGPTTSAEIHRYHGQVHHQCKKPSVKHLLELCLVHK